jgi:hypothetical protein
MRFKIKRDIFWNCQRPIPEAMRNSNLENPIWYIEINNLEDLERLSMKYGSIEINFIDENIVIKSI